MHKGSISDVRTVARTMELIEAVMPDRTADALAALTFSLVDVAANSGVTEDVVVDQIRIAFAARASAMTKVLS